jgi:hypothetical protein
MFIITCFSIVSRIGSKCSSSHICARRPVSSLTSTHAMTNAHFRHPSVRSLCFCRVQLLGIFPRFRFHHNPLLLQHQRLGLHRGCSRLPQSILRLDGLKTTSTDFMAHRIFEYNSILSNGDMAINSVMEMALISFLTGGHRCIHCWYCMSKCWNSYLVPSTTQALLKSTDLYVLPILS